MSETRSDSQNRPEGAGYTSDESVSGHSVSTPSRGQRPEKAIVPRTTGGKGLMGLRLSESSQVALQSMPIIWPKDLEDLPWGDSRRYKYYKAYISTLGRNYRALPLDFPSYDLPPYAGGRVSPPRLPRPSRPNPARPFTVTKSGDHVHFADGALTDVINPEPLLMDTGTSGWDPKSIMTIDEVKAHEDAERENSEAGDREREEEAYATLKRRKVRSDKAEGSSRVAPIFGRDKDGKNVQFFPAGGRDPDSEEEENDVEEEEDLELLNLAQDDEELEPKQPHESQSCEAASSNTAQGSYDKTKTKAGNPRGEQTNKFKFPRPRVPIMILDPEAELNEDNALSDRPTTVTMREAKLWRQAYELGDGVKIKIPGPENVFYNPPPGYISVHEAHLHAGWKLPMADSVAAILRGLRMPPCQLAPNALGFIICFGVYCKLKRIPFTLENMLKVFRLMPSPKDKKMFYFVSRAGYSWLRSIQTSWGSDWWNRYIYVRRTKGQSWNLPKKFRWGKFETPRLPHKFQDDPSWLQALYRLKNEDKKFFFCYSSRPLPYLAGLKPGPAP